MSGKFTTVRLSVDGEHFEILVHPDNALSFKQGKKMELSQVIAIDEVYSDASKGLRVSSENLKKHFDTSDHTQVAQMILERGELQLTSEQRRKMIDDKKKQIIVTIARNYLDPRTGLPHPATRIEQSMKEIRIPIDPFKDTQDQVKSVVEQMRSIIPLKSEKMKIKIKVPPQFSPQAIGVVKNTGEILSEEWNSDGSWSALIEVSAGMHTSLMERLGGVTRGSAQINVLR
jgi:ribosome maturation protein SDO1